MTQDKIVQCLKKKLRVKEVSAHEYERKWGVSKLPTYKKAYLTGFITFAKSLCERADFKIIDYYFGPRDLFTYALVAIQK